jgi:hypothetical protein
LNTDGTGFTTLHSFSALSSGTNSDGANYPDDRPFYATVLSGNRLYNTAPSGGSGGNGTIFSLSLPVVRPELTIAPGSGTVVLAWPTDAAGFTLQSTTNLDLSAFWATNSAAPVVVNGQNTVTNPISGVQQFYRLVQ